jgi:hypothetical protein
MEVAVMSLSTREQQALDGIENGLAGSDPKLAWLLGAFTRLTSGEVMPAREEIRSQVGWTHRLGTHRLGTHRLGTHRLGTHGTHRLGQRACRLLAAFADLNHAMALLWMLLTVGMIALAVGLSGVGGNGRACAGSWASACAAPRAYHSGPVVPSAG